jgi:hypothetical protein
MSDPLKKDTQNPEANDQELPIEELEKAAGGSSFPTQSTLADVESLGTPGWNKAQNKAE